MANSAMTTGDFPMGQWTPLWSGPNFVGGQLLYDTLPPNHDMSPAPAARYEPASATCPHCGKPLSE